MGSLFMICNLIYILFFFPGTSVIIMQLDYTHLKVDQTLLHFEDNYLLISNINIPEPDFVNLDQILDRVQQFVNEDYHNLNDIYYQVCATYDLRNTTTGEIKHWSGSFNPRGNRQNVLKTFQPYTVYTFKDQVIQACHPNNIYNCLRFYHVETSWVFHKLTSAIISIQVEIDPLHPTVERRNLLNVRYGRFKRVHLTFLLP
jgi:hypothetical protein